MSASPDTLSVAPRVLPQVQDGQAPDGSRGREGVDGEPAGDIGVHPRA